MLKSIKNYISSLFSVMKSIQDINVFSNNSKLVYENILELIGNTPMVKLNRITTGLKSKILAKLEFYNPGGSVKDRIAIRMIESAEKHGLIKPGYTLIEPTSGNTGIGLALAAIIKGYKVICTMPDKVSKEKINLLKALGAEVIITPTAVPPEDPRHYTKVAERLNKEISNSIILNQYYNPANPEAHYRTTGPEIWKQTNGEVDVLVAGIGTGGTITGVGRFLKEKKPEIKIIGVDPVGSMYYYEHRRIRLNEKYDYSEVVHPYKIEGIGEDFIPLTVDLNIIDEIIKVSDRDAFLTARRLAKEEGILAGGSSGAAVFAALQIAKREDFYGKTIVVILPDTGRNYLNEFYSDEWMKEQGLL